MTPAPKAHRRIVLKLTLLTLGMFGFGFALAPLYDLFCQVTGANGKTGRLEVAAVPATVDKNRMVTVEFTGHASTGLPWEFRPLQKKISVHPGETVVVRYYVRNNTDEEITGQAIPSVSPGRAAGQFKKIECFCFTKQKLLPREAREMPVQFVVMPNLPPEVQTITLSYSFFNTDRVSARKYGGDGESPAHDHHAHVHTNSGG